MEEDAKDFCRSEEDSQLKMTKKDILRAPDTVFLQL